MITDKIDISLSNTVNLKTALVKSGVSDAASVRKLCVSGTFNYTHFSDIFEQMKSSLQELDLSNASYDAYFVKKTDFFSYYHKEAERYHELYTSDFCDTLVSISFPLSVTKLSAFLFFRFKNLISITVPDEHEFYAAENGILFSKDKTRIVRCPAGYAGGYAIPDTVVEIGEHAFYNCTGLTSVIIPDTVVDIGDHAFYGCIGLTSVVIPGTVVKIGDHAFDRCSGITSLFIPLAVEIIGDSAFSTCTGLKSVKIDNPAIKLGHHAFYGCKELTSLDMPKTVKYKRNCVFDYCEKLSLYVDLVKEEKNNQIKQVKIKNLQEKSAFEWVDMLMKNSKYPYKIEQMSTKLQLFVMINDRQKLVIPVPLKHFQNVVPKLMEAIQRFETSINEFGFPVFIDNMINDKDGWISKN